MTQEKIKSLEKIAAVVLAHSLGEKVIAILPPPEQFTEEQRTKIQKDISVGLLYAAEDFITRSSAIAKTRKDGHIMVKISDHWDPLIVKAIAAKKGPLPAPMLKRIFDRAYRKTQVKN